MIVDVADGSPAQSVGFQRGDVVLAVNNDEDRQDRATWSGSTKASSAGVWRVTILRGGQQMSARMFGG